MRKSKQQVIVEVYNICERHFQEKSNTHNVLYNIGKIVLAKRMDGEFFDNYKARNEKIPIPLGYRKEFGNYFNYLKRFNKPTLMRFVCRELKERKKVESELTKSLSEIDKRDKTITNLIKLRQEEGEKYFQELKEVKCRNSSHA